MKNFAIVGAAGFVAERHMRAIKETGNCLVCCCDPFDVMGKIDSYFPDAEYFNHSTLMFDYIKSLKGTDRQVDYISICTPNYLHMEHIILSLECGANVICEKPLVIHPEQIKTIERFQSVYGGKVFTVLQLRYHDAIKDLKASVESGVAKADFGVYIEYITSRGEWYHKSWKGDKDKSGGLATNIGVHLFDMLIWVFGDIFNNKIHYYNEQTISGTLLLKKATVKWMLSIDESQLPENLPTDTRTYRSMLVNGVELEFSKGFTNLHTKTYEQILAGNGFAPHDTYPSIKLVEEIRKMTNERKFYI